MNIIGRQKKQQGASSSAGRIRSQNLSVSALGDWLRLEQEEDEEIQVLLTAGVQFRVYQRV